MYFKTSVNEKLVNLLESNGYIYRNQKTDIIIRKIILNVLNRIGKSYSKALIYQMCNLYGLSQNELLSNYELFEQSITKVLGKTGYPIILRIKKELLKYLVLNKFEININEILDPSFNVPKIINKLVESDNYKLISEILNKRNHTILLGRNDKYIEKIINNALQISKNTRNIKRIVIQLHDQFDEKRYFKYISDMDVYYLHDIVSSSSDKSVKNNNNNNINFINFEQYNKSNIQVFCFIDLQILNQLDNYKILKKLEEKFEKLYILNENVQIYCIYDLSNFSTTGHEINLLKDFINHHNVVVIDEPLLMYQKYDQKVIF